MAIAIAANDLLRGGAFVALEKLGETHALLKTSRPVCKIPNERYVSTKGVKRKIRRTVNPTLIDDE